MKTPAQLTEGITPQQLADFKEQLKICNTGKDSKGNSFNNIGQMNAGCWIGEHSGILIAEIERLQKACNSLPKLVEALQQVVNGLELHIKDRHSLPYGMPVFAFDEARAVLKELGL